MEGIEIGCGLITWRGKPEEEALADVAQAGYAGAPPRLRPSSEVAAVQDLFGTYHLKPAPPYFGAPFWLAEAHDEIVGAARDHARFARDLGCTEMYVAAGGDYTARSGKTRRQVAGHVSPDDAMSEDEFKQFAATLNAYAKITAEEGVASCFHNHVGTVVETEDELERLLALTSPDVWLGLDTGHLQWGGADAVAVCRKHVDRIKTLHLKDIDEQVRQEGARAGWDYGTFVDHGIFAELGEGVIDFPALKSLLDGSGFAGWLIVETDVTQKPTALESATISRNYLKSLGL